MFVDAEGGSSNARADQIPIGVIRCFHAESGQLAPLQHPTSPPRRPASLATSSHPRVWSIQITRNLIRHWSSALPSAYRPSPPCVQKVLSCFLLTHLCSVFPYQQPNHCTKHHITMGSIGEEPAKCPLRVANTAAGGTKVLQVSHSERITAC
jgi:hypothetical protein